jgi:MerR family transcriptional regulator, light-induced transcriptional regulator
MIPAGSPNPSRLRVQAVYDVYLQALLAGDRLVCLELVQQLVREKVSLDVVYLELFERSLYQVGDLWESDQISVGVEHMATAITESAMTLLYPLIFATPRCGHRAVVSCIADEFHQIGAKIVADIFEFHGWDGYFLGANVPETALLWMIQEKRPDFLCLSLTVQANLPILLKNIEAVRASFPQQEILLGGQAFRLGEVEAVKSLPAVTCVESIHHLEEIIRECR